MKNNLKYLMFLITIGGAIANCGLASPIIANGSVPFTFFGVSVNTPGAYAAHTQFTVASVMVSNNGTGSFDGCSLSADCVPSGSSALLTTPFNGDTLTGVVLKFGANNRYTYTVSAELPPQINHNALNTTDIIFTLGTFHDTVGTFSDGAASLVFAFTESGSATFATPPADLPVPEPASLFLTATALCAGFVGRKVRRKAS